MLEKPVGEPGHDILADATELEEEKLVVAGWPK